MRFYASFYHYVLVVLFCLILFWSLSVRSVWRVWVVVAVFRTEVPLSAMMLVLLVEGVVSL